MPPWHGKLLSYEFPKLRDGPLKCFWAVWWGQPLPGAFQSLGAVYGSLAKARLSDGWTNASGRLKALELWFWAASQHVSQMDPSNDSGRFKAVELGASNPRSDGGTAECFLLVFETDGSILEMLPGASKPWSYDGGSLAKAHPGIANCFLRVETGGWRLESFTAFQALELCKASLEDFFPLCFFCCSNFSVCILFLASFCAALEFGPVPLLTTLVSRTLGTCGHIAASLHLLHRLRPKTGCRKHFDGLLVLSGHCYGQNGHVYTYGVASKFGYGSARGDPDVWIGLDHLRFGMDRGYGSACGFRVWIGALHFDSQPYVLFAMSPSPTRSLAPHTRRWSTCPDRTTLSTVPAQNGCT